MTQNVILRVAVNHEWMPQKPPSHEHVNLYSATESTICLGKGMEGLRVPASAPQERAREYAQFFHCLFET